jgi:hypothetical protein
MAILTPEAQAAFGGTYAHQDDLWLGVFFTPTEKSQAAGRAFLKRVRPRQENRDPEVNDKVARAQVEAISKWVLHVRTRLAISERFSTRRL